MFAIQYAFQFLMIVVDRCGIVVDRCGSLWIVVDRWGSLWVVPGFSNYVFSTLRKYSSSDTLSQLPMNIHRNYQRNLTRVFSVCSEMPSDSK